ncbi:MAG: hypothetical protein ACTS27_04885 [Phycisphaerales bacterium]
MRSLPPTVVGTAILCAGIAAAPHAAAEGNFSTFWRQVDNRFSSATGQPTGLAGNFITFDLFLAGDPGTRVNAINMGYDADPSLHPEYLYHNGNVFHDEHNPGYFGMDPTGFPYYPTAEFDTYVAMGDTRAGAMSVIEPAMDLDSNLMRGIWFLNPGNPEFPYTIDESGEMLIMRLTVSSDTTQIGGLNSMIQVGTLLNGNPTEPSLFISVPIVAQLVVPAPAAAGVLALGALVAVRRRR